MIAAGKGGCPSVSSSEAEYSSVSAGLPEANLFLCTDGDLKGELSSERPGLGGMARNCVGVLQPGDKLWRLFSVSSGV